MNFRWYLCLYLNGTSGLVRFSVPPDITMLGAYITVTGDAPARRAQARKSKTCVRPRAALVLFRWARGGGPRSVSRLAGPSNEGAPRVAARFLADGHTCANRCALSPVVYRACRQVRPRTLCAPLSTRCAQRSGFAQCPQLFAPLATALGSASATSLHTRCARLSVLYAHARHSPTGSSLSGGPPRRFLP